MSRDPELTNILVQELSRHLVNLEQLVATGDSGETTMESARRTVHALKGSAGLAGEPELAGSMLRLERRLREADHSALSETVSTVKRATKLAGLPLPLGGNVLRRDIPLEIQSELSAILRQSIEFGLAHRAEAVQHSMPYARDMGSDLASKFIGMYVNEFTRDYGEVGREAIRRFLREARERGYVDREVSIDFVE